MLSRRAFVRETSMAIGGALVVPPLVGAVAAPLQAGATATRRQVLVGGRRVKTVDVHAHCVVPGVSGARGQAPPANNAQMALGPERLKQMDAQGIDVEVLSINPSWYALERDAARDLIQKQNEGLAELCAAQPDRFVGLATVSLQHPDLAAEQLEIGMKRLGLHGASVGASINSEELASARFDPFWAKAQELGAGIFIHPQGIPELQARLRGNGLLTNVIGNPLDTTIALSRLIFEGTLDRFPELKLCAAHGGGYLPSYADRSDHGCLTFPDQCNGTIKKRPTEYLKQLYFDSLVFTSEALRHLVAVAGASQIMIGTDYPFPWTTTAVDHILSVPGLSDPDRVAILGGNAAKLFRILS